MSNLERILEVWEKLGDYERKVLTTLANRIYYGQRQFGKLTPAKKEWGYEAWEESLDQSVYLAMALVESSERLKAKSDAEEAGHVTDRE